MSNLGKPVGKIGSLLKEKGYSQKDLADRLGMDYFTVCAYCRASDRSYRRVDVWDKIVATLKEMGVDWNG